MKKRGTPKQMKNTDWNKKKNTFTNEKYIKDKKLKKEGENQRKWKKEKTKEKKKKKQRKERKMGNVTPKQKKIK